MRSRLTPDAERRLLKAVDSGMDGALVRERFGLTEGQVTNLLGRLRRQRREAMSARSETAHQSDPANQQDAAGG